MSVTVARLSGTVAAAIWIVGMPLVGLGGLIPSNPEYSSMGVYFLFGVVGVVFGASMATMAVASAYDRAQRGLPWEFRGRQLPSRR